MDDLIADADAVAADFVAGRHLFQDEAHLRGLLFDALTAQASALRDWAAAAKREVDRWPTVAGDDRARRRAVRRMGDHLRRRAGRA